MFWYPAYRVSATVLFITAVVSWMAVFGLFKIIPTALQLKSPELLEKTIKERTLELEASNSVLQQLNQELRLSKQESEKLMKQKEEFLGIASHELKTPLTILKAYTQLLTENKDLENNAKENIQQKMHAQINRLSILIYDLLDTTKIKEGMMLYAKEKINLGEVVKEVMEEMQHTSFSHKFVITEISDNEIIGDRHRISQVLMNMLSNAVKYSPSGSTIAVSVKNEAGNVICAVKDHGFGIAADQQNKIFEKFYRGKGSMLHTYPGMGLGLHIAETIVVNHDGKIWVES